MYVYADGRLRHAFIGIGFRERTEAYDFQAALHDHMKYIPSTLQLFYSHLVYLLNIEFAWEVEL